MFKEILALSIAAVMAIGIFSGAVVSCQYQDRKALKDCIEKTGKPRECRHSINAQY
jgi:hypothetical protein